MSNKYAILTPEGQLDSIVEGDLPTGKSFAEMGVLPVDATIAPGYEQDFSQGPVRARGWVISSGVVVPIVRAIVVTPPSQAEIYLGKLVLGYLDSATGIKLKCDDGSRNLFTQQATLYQVAVAAGAMTVSDTVLVWDFDGNQHSLTLANFYALILRYGNYCFGLYRDYAP